MYNPLPDWLLYTQLQHPLTDMWPLFTQLQPVLEGFKLTTTELVEHDHTTSSVDNTICFHDNSDGHHANLTYFDNVEFSGDSEQDSNPPDQVNNQSDLVI